MNRTANKIGGANRRPASPYKRCTNCSTIRYRLIAKGLCKRCYPLKLRLRNLEKWDLSDPNSLKGIPNSLVPLIRTQEELDGFKADAKEQIGDRLTYLRMREEKLNGKINGIDLEYQLQRIARMIFPKERALYHGIAGFMEDNFAMKQKKLLYNLLSKIEEKHPWKGVHYGKHAAKASVKLLTEKLKKSVNHPLSK